jgi:hypothetical protein
VNFCCGSSFSTRAPAHRLTPADLRSASLLRSFEASATSPASRPLFSSQLRILRIRLSVVFVSSSNFRKPSNFSIAARHAEVIRSCPPSPNLHRRLVKDRGRHLARHARCQISLYSLYCSSLRIPPIDSGVKLHTSSGESPHAHPAHPSCPCSHSRLPADTSRQTSSARSRESLCNRIRTHARRVGTHVGDEADRALLADLDALIQPLRHAHRAAHVEAQPARMHPAAACSSYTEPSDSACAPSSHTDAPPLRLIQLRD